MGGRILSEAKPPRQFGAREACGRGFAARTPIWYIERQGQGPSAMRLPALSFRWKMVGPAAAASAAMLLATFAAAWLLSGSVNQLRALEERHFPLLQLSNDLEVRVGAVQRQLQDAAATEDPGAVDAADLLVEDLRRTLEAAPVVALSPGQRAELLGAVDGWYQMARGVTLRLVQRDAAPDLRDAVKAMGARYKMLRADLGASTELARAEVAAGFARSRQVQELVRTWGLVLVVIATVVAVGIALLLAREAARRLENLARAAVNISEGDLTQTVVVEGEDEVGELARSFGRMGERLRVIVRTLKDSSTELAEASSALVEHTEAQTENVQRQAAGVTETSTTTRELEQASSVAAAKAASVLEVARRAGQMSETGREAADRSLEGLRSIQGAVEALVSQSAKLLEQARQVGDVVETVRDLAMQSHVLSLNASIEAARAGEAGKGFGVVASEVRALAEQSGRAAAHIGRIVKEILGAIQATLETTEASTRGMAGSAAQIRASGESLREIGGIVGETSEAALQIAGAVQQQSQGVAQIAAAMRDLDKGMVDTVGRIERLRESASRLTETATRISLIADGFKL